MEGRSTTYTDVVYESRDPEQEYFFTTGWQQLVQRAEADLAQGCIVEFATVEDLFADLDG